MQKITTHLWFDKEAREAAALYTSIFPDSRVKSTTVLDNTPSGSVDIVTIDLMGHEFTLLSAGPLFKFTPAISFMVSCPTKELVDELWRVLWEHGFVLMELGEYPFSERYGWVQDRYGLSWQLIYDPRGETESRITPSLLFVGEQAGRTEEAIEFYTSVFHDSKVRGILRYGADEQPDKEGTVKHAMFTIEGVVFAAMDSAHEHKFGFNEAISFLVNCRTQEEIDYYWEKLSADPNAEQCGWLKDKFGVSWQVVPVAMNEMLESGDKERVARVTEAFLKMKKFDLATLQAAYDGV
jgi:predicted 3-demethylubiquinone-9 3-methyltransferase (glyoxalase superfamily)